MAVGGLTKVVRYVSVQTAGEIKIGGVGIDGCFMEVALLAHISL
jgi:hypothetical protein